MAEKKTPESQLEAQKKYDKNNTRYFGIKLNRNTDAALIDKLEQQESFQRYIKELIRKDIAAGEGK